MDIPLCMLVVDVTQQSAQVGVARCCFFGALRVRVRVRVGARVRARVILTLTPN